MRSGANEKFPKSARLRKRPEFLTLSRTGRKVHSANFVVVTGKNERGEIRLGITVSGKVGNAVVRNRIKRRVREFFRRQRHGFPGGMDVLVIARPSAAALSFHSIADEISRSLMERAAQRK
jgi:ribonuclease P protein component